MDMKRLNTCFIIFTTLIFLLKQEHIGLRNDESSEMMGVTRLHALQVQPICLFVYLFTYENFAPTAGGLVDVT